MKKQQKKENQSTNKKQIMVTMLAMVLVAVVSVVGTLAYLGTKSDKVENTFTASENIKLTLAEPMYNVKTDASGVLQSEAKDEDEPNPLHFSPGLMYQKNPMLFNTCDESGVYEWVAMRVDYAIDTNEDGDCDDLVDARNCTDMCSNKPALDDSTDKYGIIDAISFDTEKWIKLENAKVDSTSLGASFFDDKLYDIYIYKYPLSSSSTVTEAKIRALCKDTIVADDDIKDTNDTKISASTDGSPTSRTTALFPSITIKTQEKIKENNYVDGSGIVKIPNFKITTVGAAIKAESDIATSSIPKIDFDGGEAESKSKQIATELVKLLKD